MAVSKPTSCSQKSSPFFLVKAYPLTTKISFNKPTSAKTELSKNQLSRSTNGISLLSIESCSDWCNNRYLCSKQPDKNSPRFGIILQEKTC